MLNIFSKTNSTGNVSTTNVENNIFRNSVIKKFENELLTLRNSSETSFLRTSKNTTLIHVLNLKDLKKRAIFGDTIVSSSTVFGITINTTKFFKRNDEPSEIFLTSKIPFNNLLQTNSNSKTIISSTIFITKKAKSIKASELTSTEIFNFSSTSIKTFETSIAANSSKSSFLIPLICISKTSEKSLNITATTNIINIEEKKTTNGSASFVNIASNLSIRVTKKNNKRQICCQTCNECYQNLSCCCTEITCHPIVITCDSPIDKTRWYIGKMDFSDQSEYQQISNRSLMIKASIIEEFLINGTLDTNVFGNDHETKIIFNRPRFSFEHYVIRAIYNDSVKIFDSKIFINGSHIKIPNYVNHSMIICYPNAIPCKLRLMLLIF